MTPYEASITFRPAFAGKLPMKILDKHNITMFTMTALACAVAIVVVIPLWTWAKSKLPLTSTTTTGS